MLCMICAWYETIRRPGQMTMDPEVGSVQQIQQPSGWLRRVNAFAVYMMLNAAEIFIAWCETLRRSDCWAAWKTQI